MSKKHARNAAASAIYLFTNAKNLRPGLMSTSADGAARNLLQMPKRPLGYGLSAMTMSVIG